MNEKEMQDLIVGVRDKLLWWALSLKSARVTKADYAELQTLVQPLFDAAKVIEKAREEAEINEKEYVIYIQRNDDWEKLTTVKGKNGESAIEAIRKTYHDQFTEWFGEGNEKHVNLDYELVAI
ncbi:hypothetical protein NW801_13660 [Brevibacillus laterosporus]|uniref:Uncharacterized protein n=1 Tax=Brevibacillus halotolerans TaxID=1507437 RepID=A0ABT4HYC8_9BACL|nr:MULTISPECIES: hypothetical protein [Brevibacillus]MCR8986070.1 hypothetical protein [Brevibacillus laterosporus]MCZ0831803.1 hypothetical protein [Brevibacillus halotolerans]